MFYRRDAVLLQFLKKISHDPPKLFMSNLNGKLHQKGWRFCWYYCAYKTAVVEVSLPRYDLNWVYLSHSAAIWGSTIHSHMCLGEKLLQKYHHLISRRSVHVDCSRMPIEKLENCFHSESLETLSVTWNDSITQELRCVPWRCSTNIFVLAKWVR